MQSISPNKAFYLLFGIFSVALFMLFSLANKIAPLTISHAVYYCQKTLSNIFITLPHLAPSLISLVFIVIASIGLFLLAGQLLKNYLFIRKIVKQKAIIPYKIYGIAKELGIADKVDVVKNELFLSFCYRFIKPRICLSLKLVKTLNRRELKAVLIHESYHLKNRDPLKILLSRIATSMFFFIPTIKDIHNYYTLSKEVAADQIAIQYKYTNELKSVLTKVLLNPAPALNGVASFAGDYNLEQRINILIDKQKLSLRISITRLLMSFFIFILALVILNMPVYAIETGTNAHVYLVCPTNSSCNGISSCSK